MSESNDFTVMDLVLFEPVMAEAPRVEIKVTKVKKSREKHHRDKVQGRPQKAINPRRR